MKTHTHNQKLSSMSAVCLAAALTIGALTTAANAGNTFVPPTITRNSPTSSAYQLEFNEMLRRGYQLLDVKFSTVAGQVKVTSKWRMNRAAQWTARHDMTSAQYQSEYNRLSRLGYQLKDVDGYSSSGQSRFAAVWEKGSPRQLITRHDLTDPQYVSQNREARRLGYRLVSLDSYKAHGTRLYTAIWQR